MPAPLLDPARLAKLEKLGGRTLVTQLIDSFAAEAVPRRAALARAAAEGDLELLGATAHLLVAGAGQLGAAPLSELARSTEEAVRRADRPGALALVPDLISALDAALAALATARETP